MQAWGRGRDVMAGDPVMERETELGIIQKGFFLGVKPAFCNSQWSNQTQWISNCWLNVVIVSGTPCVSVFFGWQIRWCRFSHHQAWGKISFMDVKITERTVSICVLDLKTAQWSIKQVMSSCKNTFKCKWSTCYPHWSNCLQTDLCLRPKAKSQLCTCFPFYRLLPGSLIHIALKKNYHPKRKIVFQLSIFQGLPSTSEVYPYCNRIKKASQKRPFFPIRRWWTGIAGVAREVIASNRFHMWSTHSVQPKDHNYQRVHTWGDLWSKHVPSILTQMWGMSPNWGSLIAV